MYQTSLWEEESFFAPKDFVIVGSGFAGLWTAHELTAKFPKASIAILERGAIPSGASTRNAGFACFGSPTEMLSDITSMGEDAMWETVEMRYKGIEKVRKVFGDAAIGFDAVGGYECYNSTLHNLRQLEENIYKLNKGMKGITGLIHTFSWCNDKLPEQGLKGFDAMVENSLEGGLHSGKLAMALIRKITEAGASILTGVTVKNWYNEDDYIVINTSSFSIKTSKLILATNAFTTALTSTLPVCPARGQVLVTDPVPGLALRGTFHFDAGYYYFRNVGNRVLIGGARNKAFDDEANSEMVTTEIIQSELEKFLAEHILPDINYTISHRWSGIMGFTDNKKPFVGEVEPNVYAVITCNGMGVALSPVIAEKLVSIVE